MFADKSTKKIFSWEELASFSKENLLEMVLALQETFQAKADEEQQIKQHLNNLQNLINYPDDLICSVDLNYRILTINEAYVAYVKKYYQIDLQIGDELFSYYPEEIRGFWLKLLAKGMNGETVTRTYASSRIKGNYWQVTVYPLYGADNQIIGANYYVKDISQLKNSEIQLQEKANRLLETEANFTALIENTDDYICSINTDYQLIIINSAYQNYLFKRYNVLFKKGDIVFDYMDEAFNSFWRGLCQRVFDGEKITQIFKSSHEQNAYWQAALNPIYNEEKKISGVSFFIKNISDLVKTEKELRAKTRELSEKEADLTALIENTQDLICSVDADYKLITANNAYLNYIFKRYNHSLKKGTYMFEQSPEDVKEYWLPIYNRALQGESFKLERHYLIENQDIWLEHSFNPIREENGKIRGVSFYIKNITEIKLKEQALQKSNEELTKRNNELDRFVYSVSHDLRAPLASILGLIEISKNENDLNNRDNYLQLMQKSIYKLDEFIKEIIEYSRNNRVQINVEPIDFEQLIKDIFAELSFMQESKPIDLKIKINKKIPFYSDLHRLKVIFNNLISNAIRYSDKYKPKPFIAIKIEIEEKNAFIEICDNGQGIGENHLNKVFEMFYRANSKTNGSGLGLYIVKESMDKLGGEISVESKIGEGTKFKIHLPNLKYQ
jgi:PAS domain S-box-containing protein